MNNKKFSLISIWVITGTLAVLTGLLLIFFIAFTGSLSSPHDDVTYGKYYVLITDNPGSSFWQSVYSSMLEEAKEQDAYVEMIAENLSGDYAMTDLMEMAIAARADGIIVTAGEADGMTELIEKAYNAGIPVITLLNDNTNSERLSFVGVGNYNLGKEYGKLIIDMANFREFAGETIDVTVLLDAGSEDSGQNVLAAAIQEAIEKDSPDAVGRHKPIAISLEAVDASNNFSVEESVRKLFVSGKENIPDIIVCLNENDTNSVYQAVVDYNEVGRVNILGYYDSDAILKGIERDVIRATLSIDTGQLGRYCIDALTEYYETGNTSQYFTADSYVIDKTNVGEYRKGEKHDQ